MSKSGPPGTRRRDTNTQAAPFRGGHFLPPWCAWMSPTVTRLPLARASSLARDYFSLHWQRARHEVKGHSGTRRDERVFIEQLLCIGALWARRVELNMEIFEMHMTRIRPTDSDCNARESENNLYHCVVQSFDSGPGTNLAD